MVKLEVVNPESLGAPKGYSNGVLAPAGARVLFVAGQVGWDREGRFSPDFVAQFEKALSNILEVVRAAGGGPESIARITAYVTDKQEYLARQKDLGRAWRSLMGKWYPAMALIEIKGLYEEGAKLELEATAVVA